MNENLFSKAINITKGTVDNLRRLIGFVANIMMLKSAGIKQDQKYLTELLKSFETAGIEGSENTLDAKQLKDMFEYLKGEVNSNNIKSAKELIVKMEEILGFQIA